MLDQLLNSEHSQLFDIVKNFKGVSDDQNDTATSLIKDTIISSLTNQAKNGDMSALMEMFSGTESRSDSQAASGLSSDLMSNLTGKLGLDSSNASSLIKMVLPLVLNMFNNKVNNAQSNGIDVAGLIGQFIGGGQQKAGGADIAAILNMFTGGGGNQQQNQNDGFGLDDIINIGKKLF